MLEQCLAEEDQLFKAHEHYRDEVANLIRMIQVKADEREQKSKDFLKAQVRVQQRSNLVYQLLVITWSCQVL